MRIFDRFLAAMLVGLVCLFAYTPFVFAQDGAGVFIAGVNPHQRPADAPEITRIRKNKAWFLQAYHGIEVPFPDGLDFLIRQGAWYTPFNSPGMTGPYDLRGWYQQN